MEKYDHMRYIFLFLFTCGLGLTHIVLPHLKHVYVLFADAFLLGFANGSLAPGGNAQCLYIWRNRQSGPYVHSIHTSYALGAFVSPFLAAPLLSTRSSTVKRLEAAGKNETDIEGYLKSSEASEDSRVAIFFALSGGVTVIISLGFLYFGLKAVANHKEHLKREEADADNNVTHNNEEEKRAREAEKPFWSFSILFLSVLECIFFFFYVGLERSVSIYLTTFSVKSKLQLSRSQGAHVTSVYSGAITIMRVITIFVAAKAKPSIIMWFNLVLCLGGSIAAVFFAEHSPEVLQVIAGVLGIGMASIYATNLLWLEQFMAVSSCMCAAFSIAGAIGIDVYTPLLGQFIVNNPMVFMWTVLATVMVWIGIFVAAIFVAKIVQAQTKTKTASDRDVEPE